MPTTTANLGLTLPTPNVDTGWGSTLNTDFTTIDNLFASNGTGTSVGLQVGSGRTLVLSGTMVLGSGDGTGSVTAPTIRGAARTGTNVVGANLTIDAANGTGTGGSGSLIFRTAPPGAAGATANTMQTSLLVDGLGRINFGPSSMDWANGGNVTMGDTSAIGFAGTTGHVSTNTYFNGTWRANTNVPSGLYVQTSGNHLFYNAPAIAAGSAVALSERLRVGTAGQIGIAGANYGTAGQVLTSNGSGSSVSWSNPSIGAIGAQTFAAGGNSFFGIPAWAKSIIMTVGYMDKSSSTTDVLVRIGTSAGFVAAGYISSGSAITGAGANTINNSTGFVINIGNSIGSGTIRLTVVNGVSWICEHTIGTTTTKTCVGGGLVTLPAVLDRIQIIPISGTFAASGAVEIFYQ